MTYIKYFFFDKKKSLTNLVPVRHDNLYPTAIFDITNSHISNSVVKSSLTLRHESELYIRNVVIRTHLWEYLSRVYFDYAFRFTTFAINILGMGCDIFTCIKKSRMNKLHITLKSHSR